jgi:oligopeptide transport system ATP-binding protein
MTTTQESIRHLNTVSAPAIGDRFEQKPKVLEVNNLTVNFNVHGGQVYAVRSVSFYVRQGECLCIVGESGSGKSVTVQALMGLLPTPPAKIVAGEALLLGKDILKMNPAQRRKHLGTDIAMVFQDPLASLNPTMTVGNQLEETLILHTQMNKNERRTRILELLNLVRIPEPERRIDQYPHELSGGMRQRIMIAMALSCNPKVLIADEPTTALDVTIQAQILALMKELAEKLNMATVLITHDLGVVAQMAHRVGVMYGGKIVEEGPVDDIFYSPKHPYTLGLKKAMPQEGSTREPLKPIPGTPPDLFSPPAGCAFAVRCPNALKVCHTFQPPEQIRRSSENRALVSSRVSCWLHHPMAETQLHNSGLSSIIPSQRLIQ